MSNLISTMPSEVAEMTVENYIKSVMECRNKVATAIGNVGYVLQCGHFCLVY